MYEDDEPWTDNPRTTGLALLAFLLSPMSGPMLFLLSAQICGRGAENVCPIQDFVLFSGGGLIWWGLSLVGIVVLSGFFLRAVCLKLLPT